MNIEEQLENLLENNNFNEFKEILSNSNVNPSYGQNALLRIACDLGFVDFVEFLLNDYRVSPVDIDQYAIRAASRAGHTNVVALLLKDKRVKPESLDNYSIKTSLSTGCYSTSKLLFANMTVRQTLQINDKELLQYLSKKFVSNILTDF